MPELPSSSSSSPSAPSDPSAASAPPDSTSVPGGSGARPTRRRTRVVVGSPVSEELCQYIEKQEPRVEVVRDQQLYRPMRHAADHIGDPAFRRAAQQQADFEAMVDSADILYGVPDMDPAALARTAAANQRLRWVQTMPAGGGAQVRAAGLDPDQLERIVFTTSAGVHGGPLAEFAVFGVMAGAKGLPRLQQDQRRKHWPELRWQMRQVSDFTVLVLGLGGIGREVAAKFSALGATVWGTSRSARPAEHVERVVALSDLHQLLPEVDAVVVTLPGTAATENLLDRAFFSALKPGAVLVNVGRGTVVDEDALLEALENGTVAFAALDVVATEPLAEDSPLWEHPKVLVSPHTAALSDQESRRITELFVENLHAFLDGAPMRNVVDTIEFY